MGPTIGCAGIAPAAPSHPFRRTRPNDLLPLPCTDEALSHVCSRLAKVQNFLGRQLAVENVSSHFAFAEATIPEWDLDLPAFPVLEEEAATAQAILAAHHALAA